jgi:hypothetical protein
VHVPVSITFMVLCPPAPLSVALLEVEPGPVALVLLWLVTGL